MNKFQQAKALLEQARKMDIHPGSVLRLPPEASPEQARCLAEMLGPEGMDMNVLIVIGDVQSLDEAAMNAAGWYRK